jgi:poly(3-hydroxybutyrate) depolymerase
MLYFFYELNHAAAMPWRAAATPAACCGRCRQPVCRHHMARSMAASLELFERLTRRYDKPEFGIDSTVVDGRSVPVTTETVWQRPFCRLLHFRKSQATSTARPRRSPSCCWWRRCRAISRRCCAAPWRRCCPSPTSISPTGRTPARCPQDKGLFDLDDYIDYLFDMLAWLGEPVHVMAVCQPAVPVLAAVSLMSQRDDPLVPLSMTLMGGPIDTRRNPTVVNDMALSRGLDWLSRHAIVRVPFPNPGHGREVYPGFLQLAGFTT